MARSVTASVYLVLVPDIRGAESRQVVWGVRVDRMRTSRPRLERGEVAVRLRLTFDEQSLIDAIPVIDVDLTNAPLVAAPQAEAAPIEAEVAS